MGELLGALQFGISGLCAILFLVTVGVLQTEQKREKVRPQVLKTLHFVMALAVFLVLVPAALAVVDQYGVRRTVAEQVTGLSRIESLKIGAVFQAVSDDITKKMLAGFLSQVCDALVDLKKAVDDKSGSSKSCTDVKEFVEAHR